ncbi:hypothetical protein NLG97_g11035 [Lecanicillium saksenae]|uniref:Uncharacterized protein n=1 Tax=Lecanicillium saksenae TaxID=468837 RepID=A0ACC1QE85_9HYPO|nr:hypothetical protein NLG97_g11035 [Lecanicillium saksenae]
MCRLGGGVAAVGAAQDPVDAHAPRPAAVLPADDEGDGEVDAPKRTRPPRGRPGVEVIGAPVEYAGVEHCPRGGVQVHVELRLNGHDGVKAGHEQPEQIEHGWHPHFTDYLKRKK